MKRPLKKSLSCTGAPSSLFRFFSSGVQAIEVKDRVIDQEVAALRFAAPHRIIGKEDDVAATGRNVYDSGVLSDLTCPVQQTGHEEFLRIGVTKYDSRTKFWRNDCRIVSLLIIRQRQSFPGFGLGQFGQVRHWPTLRKIRIVLCSPTGHAFRFGSRTQASSIREIAEVINRTLEPVGGKVVRVAVSQRARSIDQFGVQCSACCFEFLLRRKRHAWSQAERNC